MVSTRSMTTEDMHASRKRVSTKDLCTAQSKKTKKGAVAARVSMEGPTVDMKILQDIRKRILGKHIARTLPNKQHCFGKVISVQAGLDLDDDLYRVAYEDNVWEDLNSLTLFDALLCFTKIVPTFGMRLDLPLDTVEKRQKEIDDLIDLIAQYSENVLHFLHSFHFREEFEIRARVYDAKRLAFGTVIKCTVKKSSKKWTVLYDDGETVDNVCHRDMFKFSDLYKDHAEEDPVPIDPQYEELHDEIFHDLVCRRLISPPYGW